MGLVLPTIEAYPVQHLPMVQASADQRGGVEGIKPRVPTAMAIEAGTLVLGMRLETWGGPGTMPVLTACAVRAAPGFGFDQRAGHCATTSGRGEGDALPPADRQAQEHEAPLTLTEGESQAKRPALKPGVFSTVGVDRALPLWGTPHAGQASETTVHHPRLAARAPCRAQHGVAPGAALSPSPLRRS